MATVPSLLVQIGISATPRCFAFSADDLSFAKAGAIAVADQVKEINAATNAFVTSAPKRSEEHTSELQSLMRISYAVFCLKKKTPQNTNILTNSRCRYIYNIYTTI